MEKKTAKEVASTLPCACGNCGMYEDKAAEKIKEFASQELTEYKTKLKAELDSSTLAKIDIEIVKVYIDSL